MTGPRLSLRVIQDPVIRQSKPEMTILPMVEPGCGNGCGGCPRSIICNSPIKETGNELALSAAPTIVIETQSQKEFNLNAAQQALGFLDASPKDPTHFPLSAPIQVPFNVTAAQSITLAQNTGYCRGLYLFTLLMTDRLRELELYERSSPSDLSHPMPATPTEKPLQSTESELPLPKSERIVLEIPSLGVLDSALPFRAVTAQFDAEKVFFTHVPLGIEIRELASSLDFSVPISVQLSSDQASFEFDLTSASTHQSNSIQIKDGESSEASVSKGTLPVLLQKKPGKPRSNLRPVAIRRVDGAASKIRTSKIRTSNVVSQNLRRFRFVSLVQKKLQIPRADSKPPEILKTRRKIQTLEIRTEPTKEQSKLEKSKPNCPKKEQITLVDKNAKEAKLKSVQLSAAYPVSSEYSKIRKTSTKAKPSRTLLGPFFTSEASLQKNRPRTRNIRNVFALLK